MRVKQPFTCRRSRSAKRWAVLTMIAMMLSPIGRPVFQPSVQAQQQAAVVSQGFNIDAGDLRFIYEQILVAQDHAAGGVLLGPGPNQVHNAQLPRGLRTVDGSMNNLVPGQEKFGQADLVFPRLLTPSFKPAETLRFDPDGPGPQAAGQATSYAQKKGFVSDSQPRVVSNLVLDQTESNPAAVAAAHNPCGSGGFVCSGTADPDPVSGALFIPNITPDFGLSAPFNVMFTFFGQFFDHGLDLVTKGGGTVIMPLNADDPLVAGPDHIFGTADDIPADQRFMVMARATNQPGPDGVLGDNPATPQDESLDDVQEAINTTTPWVDQNQTYTSHPSHQVFLREYALNAAGKPVQTGLMLDGGFCAPRPTGIPGDNICNIGNWNDVKAQARTMLGIQLVDQDIFDVPLLLTDPYGHFKPGPNGFPQIVLRGGGVLEGSPAANGGLGVLIPANAFRTGHAFLNDIAHNAVPSPGLTPDANTTITNFRTGVQDPGTYDDELLGIHMVTGDGRGNENIALTMVHQIFHAEHNRLAHDIDRRINTLLTPQEIAAWHAVHAPSGWDYNERLFQAARFATEMQYQHLVFEEFARTIQPLINPFLGGLTSINAAISAEFAHVVYRLGHSMLPEVVTRINIVNGVETPNDIRLFDAFLAPQSYNDGGAAGILTADKAAGSIVRGLTRSVANELDEFVTESVRNQLLGLPLDLPAINMARGRSEGIPRLNVARKQFFASTRDTAVKPYANWFEFGQNLKHIESLPNFVAAYGTDPTITSATTLAGKRAAATTLVAANGPFMFASAATSGLDDVDFWPGGMAERQAVFGGLLGSTFNFVFEHQLEALQDGDRFYYLQRTDGLNFRFQLEGNSFAELIRRNTDFSGGMDVIFNTADFIFNAADLTGTAPIDLGNGMSLQTVPDGTAGPDGIFGTADDGMMKLFFDPLHTGKNITFNGGPGNDNFKADIGDDTLYGNDGDDRLDGFEGNDTLHGGNGDDVLFGGNGDDVLKGGAGNDVLSTGPGFGGDLAIGGDGNDFMIGGDDGVEYFGGPGNDIIADGSMRSEGMFGGSGDDWIYDGEGHDGGMFGDGGNVFDLLAGLSVIGSPEGDDVEGGGPGQDNHFGEGGDDIFLMSEGTNKFFGDYGFDWITQRSWPFAGDIELDLLAQPGVIVNFNDLRNFYRFVDAASGWDLNDSIRGDNNINDPAAPPERLRQPTMALSVAGAAKISGLTQLIAAFRATLPFNEGNILLGGRGNDILEGKAGDDLIDGDVWLNVQLQAPNPVVPGDFLHYDSPIGAPTDCALRACNDVEARVLADAVTAASNRINPGTITIVRSIVSPAVPQPDCGAAAPGPFNCDTAVFSGPLSEYAIVVLAPNLARVSHTGGPAVPSILNNGTDTLRNIERLQFADVTVANPASVGAAATIPVPSVVGQAQAVAVTTLSNATLVAASTNANSPTVAIGNVISQNPAAGSLAAPGSTVSIVVSVGALVPNVVALTQAAATSLLATSGLTVGSVTSVNNAAAAGTVISQSPVAGTNTAPGTGVALTVSLGPDLRTVPNLVNLTQGAATTAIQNVGLTLGAVTNASSTTIARGSVISSSPAAGALLTPGSAVAIVVSSGLPQPAGLVLALAFDEAAGVTAIDSSVSAHNGTIRQALRKPGKFGGALQFDGFDDWVTVTDTTASPLDLSAGMTLEAWVNPALMSGWECVLMKERGIVGEGLLSYALYAHDGAPLNLGFPTPAGYVRLNPAASTVDRAARGTAQIPLNTWTHLATTYDGSSQRFYVNGVLVSTVANPGTIVQANGALRIGGDASSTGEFFQGLIDEVRVYNRALSVTEITTDMNTAIVR